MTVEKQGVLFYFFEGFFYMNDMSTKNVWWDYLHEYEQWVAKHRRFPVLGRNAGFKERALYRWEFMQKKALREGMRNKKQIAAMKRLNLHKKRTEITREEKFKQLNEFIKENLRLPLLSSPNDYERKLAQWMRSVLVKTSRILPAKKSRLKRIIAPYEKSHWWDRLHEYEQWMETNKRLPSGSRKNRGSKEYSLYLWYRMQRKTLVYGKYNAKQIAAIKRLNFHVDRHELKRWLRLGQFGEFVEHNQRLPSAVSTDAHERTMAHWMLIMLNKKKQCKEKKEVVKIVTPYLVRSKAQKDTVWWDKFGMFEQWIEKHNRFPGKGKGSDIEEAKLYDWYYAQRTAYGQGTLETKQVQAIKRLKFHISRHDIQREKKFNLYCAFVKKNRRVPSANAADDFERKLAHWKGSAFFRKSKLPLEKKEYLKKVIAPFKRRARRRRNIRRQG